MQGGDIPAVIAAGLPNITGDTALRFSTATPVGTIKGAFYTNDTDKINRNNLPTGSNQGNPVLFDASKSNSIYGSSNTVQPPAICLVPQIRY